MKDKELKSQGTQESPNKINLNFKRMFKKKSLSRQVKGKFLNAKGLRQEGAPST